MCGLVGAISHNDVLNTLVEGLKYLEYRGYDSAGIAIIDANYQLQRIRMTQKIDILEQTIKAEKLTGHIGIAHTRWATHGEPSLKNAHPHIAGNQIAIVHNGILENYQSLHEKLLADGVKIESDTDSELIAHLIYQKILAGKNLLEASQLTAKELQGTFAIGIINSDEPNQLIAIRQGSPLVIGIGKNANYIASDMFALLNLTKEFILLEDGDIAKIELDKNTIYDSNLKVVERHTIHWDHTDEIKDKGKYQHYMLKEIFEQPRAISAVLEGRTAKDHVPIEIFGVKALEIFPKIKRIQIVACGTSYFAGLVGKFWIEELAHLPCQVDIASEYRYRHRIIEPDTLFITISQSGETADTLAALRLAKKSSHASTLTICNRANSALVRESELVFMCNAGLEIGVASTKSFTTQIISLLLLSLALNSYHKPNKNLVAEIIDQLSHLSDKAQQTLDQHETIEKLAHQFTNKAHAIFLGRGMEFPIALEGALKLKEISYIHAEAFPAGELKHGPLALIDENVPIIALVPKNEVFQKFKSNLEEVLARKGKLIVFVDDNSNFAKKNNMQIIKLPTVSKFLAPIIYVIPLQLLAYYVALQKGTDIDQPRNLAKSVTVE